MFHLFPLRRLLLAALLFAAPLLRADQWTTLSNCRLDESAYADGDSFHIHSGSREYIIRLYFVDCPETDDGYPDRVAKQAEYWGITSKQALKLGEKAADFTRKMLDKPFTVVTQFQDARGASATRRYFGFVLIDNGKTDFGELLVSNGLARVFGAPASRPGGRDAEGQWQHLRRLDARAKSQHLGGWGVNSPGGGAVKAGGSNDEFFQRAKERAAASPAP